MTTIRERADKVLGIEPTYKAVNGEREIKTFQIAMDRLATNEDFKVFARHMMELCGNNLPAMVANKQTGAIDPLGTIVNDAQRSIWLTVRKWIPRKALIDIEYHETPKAVEPVQIDEEETQ